MSGVSGIAWKDIKGVQLRPATLSYLSECVRFPYMAPVQARTIPLLLGTYDVVVEAITGSGKTLAYLLPCLEMLQRDRVVEACAGRKNAVVSVVVLPSRELAQQVHRVARGMLSHLRAHSGGALCYASQCFIGGRDVAFDVDLLRRSGGNVLIGTPGRLFELLVSPTHSALLDFSAFELLVLDEADKLLEFGFKAKLDAILRRLPSQRRTGLFSATQTRELAELARAGMRNPVSVTVRTGSSMSTSAAAAAGTAGTVGTARADAAKPQVPELLQNYFVFARASEKLDRLLELLRKHRAQKVLVYVMTCASVDWLHAALAEVLLRDDAEHIFALHGQMKLERRQKVHRAVTRCDRCVLICTDVAARGLDIPAVGVVVQYDPPVDPATFIHRIGRTARMGRQGESIVMLMPQEFEYVAFMRLQNVAMEPLDEARDTVDDARESARQMNAKRTLHSCARERVKPTAAAHGKRARHNLKQKGKQQQQEQDQEEGDQERGGRGEGGKRRGQEVRGDMCESAAVLALRHAAREKARLLDLAARAFVSFVRAYKEHECRYIFQLQHIDLTDLTHGFALFKIPSCGEIRHMRFLRIPLQEELAEVLETVNARTREKREQRQREEENRSDRRLAHSGDNDNEKDNDDNNDNNDNDDDNANEKTLKRHRTERNEKLEALKHAKMTHGERSRAWRQAEIDELMKDSYYVKKERRGKISRGAVDKIMGVHALENAMMSVRERQEARKTRRATN